MIEDIIYNKELTNDVNPWVYMQYTNLKDKNGKEIYEGDIVKISQDGDLQDSPIIVDMFNLKIGMEDKDRYTRFDDNFEVIGNIYENPELLKSLS